jgi:anti-anti-sigma regulatory factor
LTEVEYFGTAGISVLVEASTQHPDLRLVCCRMISRILEIGRLGEWFCLNSSLTEALTA